MRQMPILYFALGILTVVGLGAVTNQAVVSAPDKGVAVGDLGIGFPDGSFQTTAASSPVTAWPMRCHDSSLPANSSEHNLTCASVQSVPGGSFGSSDGVPTGHYFVVTDVYISPGHGATTSTGFVSVFLARRNSNDIKVGETSFKLGSDNESKLTSFRTPVFVLAPGDYLTAKNFAGSTVTTAITVTGYLTREPEMLGP